MSAESAYNACAKRFCEVFQTDTPFLVDEAQITAVVIAYNEALRLPHFLDHHEALGVGRFIIVDNASTDETATLLDGDPRVVRIYTECPYAEFKAIWREVIADLYRPDKWVLFVDVDELFVYPGWPTRDLHWYCALMDRHGQTGLFTTMVDMYPATLLDETKYEPGAPFLDSASYFDTGNYRLIPLEPNARRDWPTPPYRVFGGARERLFSAGKQREKTWLDRLILRALFPLSRDVAPAKRRRKMDKRALAYLDGVFQELSPANMSKVPLVRWRCGCRFPGGPHRLSHAYQLSQDWGALLHFKYFDDFGRKTTEAVERGQHAAGAAHYKLYRDRLQDLGGRPLTYPGSRRFRGVADLVSAGLIRISRDTWEEFERSPPASVPLEAAQQSLERGSGVLDGLLEGVIRARRALQNLFKVGD